MALSKNEKLVLGGLAIWYFFLRPEASPASIPVNTTPHPVGPVTTTATDAQGNPVTINPAQ